MSDILKKMFRYYRKEGELTHQQRMMYRDTGHQLLMQVHKKFLSNVLSDQTPALDVGCAEGWYSIWMANYAKFVLGVDISVKKLKRALNESKNLKTDFILADWDHLPFKDKVFGVALFSEGPEHSLNPRDTLLEIRRILKNGGFLSISAPVEPESLYCKFIKSKFKRKENKFSEPFKGHLRIFTPTSLKELLLRNQFEIVEKVFDMPIIDFPFRKTLEKLLGKHRLPHGVILVRKSTQS